MKIINNDIPTDPPTPQEAGRLMLIVLAAAIACVVMTLALMAFVQP